jgi:hypothetical protein
MSIVELSIVHLRGARGMRSWRCSQPCSISTTRSSGVVTMRMPRPGKSIVCRRIRVLSLSVQPATIFVIKLRLSLALHHNQLALAEWCRNISRKPRQAVTNLIPRCRRSTVTMKTVGDVQWIVEQASRDSNEFRCMASRITQFAPAHATKMSFVIGRRCETFDKLGAGADVQVSPRDLCVARKRCAVLAATHRTVAVPN